MLNLEQANSLWNGRINVYYWLSDYSQKIRNKNKFKKTDPRVYISSLIKYDIKTTVEKYYIYEITKPSLKNLTQIHSFHGISKTKSQCFSYFSLQPPWNSYNACSQLPGRNTRDRGKIERISGRHERESRINLYLVFGSSYSLALFPASCFGGAHEETRPARKKGRDKKGPVRGFL